MLDVTLFAERAFWAASGSVTVAFFSLFGFIFLITQYFQFIRGYDALSTGVRILPVALSLGAFSVLSAKFAGRLGARVIVCFGLALLAGSFLWIAQVSATIPYTIIVIQMLMMGAGIGSISTPATESILSVLPPAKPASAPLSTMPPARPAARSGSRSPAASTRRYASPSWPPAHASFRGRRSGSPRVRSEPATPSRATRPHRSATTCSQTSSPRS